MIRFLSSGLLLIVTIVTLVATTENASSTTNPQNRPRRIDSWLDFNFDPNAAVGDARNPAVILPATFATLLAGAAGAKRIGDTLVVPATEFQRIANQPLASALLAPLLNQLANVKSFDGFSAVDMTGLIKNLPSELTEAVDATARSATGENFAATRKLLRNGDLVLGSHVINYMTWGRYNHVAIVTDAMRGVLAESTATVPTDRPGVRLIEWKSFAEGFSHIGVVRLRSASADQLSRVISWLEARKGKPYRWPIIQGLDKTDQSRFYCSQLAWLAYKEVLNVDLDSDKGVLVFPDDIYYAKDFVDVIVP
jgi:uncharacterized protein YycO